MLLVIDLLHSRWNFSNICGQDGFVRHSIVEEESTVQEVVLQREKAMCGDGWKLATESAIPDLG